MVLVVAVVHDPSVLNALLLLPGHPSDRRTGDADFLLAEFVGDAVAQSIRLWVAFLGNIPIVVVQQIVCFMDGSLRGRHDGNRPPIDVVPGNA
eukprot:4079752-Pyramimonas_sp.AAC.1